MQNLISLWLGLSLNRRLIVAAATVAMFLVVLGLSRMATQPSMALLYAGLEPAAAGEVVRALEQRGVAYVVDGDSIRVDAAQRDNLRMTLAAEGLPMTGAAGYELLDGLSGFGTTSQMFDAAYWRAKEGELARTILASPAIRAARVHIARAPSQPFQPDNQPTASVTVTSVASTVSGAQARAFRHLVAAAVPGLRPEDVSVIDSVGGLVPLEEAQKPFMGSEAKAEELKRNIERLLSARVGPGHAVVEVAVELETQSESLIERIFDPKGRVLLSSETEERNASATDAGGDVTVASNLPEGDAAADGQGSSNSTETRERLNYELSETKREVLRNPGAVRRLTIAVLVDGQNVTAADGTQSWQERSEEELAVLRELVSSAAGIDEARGDILTLKSLAFEPLLAEGTPAEASILPSFGPVDVMQLVQVAVLAIVALVLGLFVIRPLLLSAPRREMAKAGPQLALPGGETAAVPPGVRVLSGEIDDSDREISQMATFGEKEADPPSPPADPVQRLRHLIETRQGESVEILRGWMEAEERRA